MRIAIELSDTTRNFDLGRKAKRYACHGVPEYWVADRQEQCVVMHSGPTPDGYGSVVPVPFGSALQCATLPRVTVETRSLLD